MENELPIFVKKYSQEIYTLEAMRREFKSFMQEELDNLTSGFEMISHRFMDVEPFERAISCRDFKFTSDYITKTTEIKLRKHENGRRSRYGIKLELRIATTDSLGNYPYGFDDSDRSGFFFFINVLNTGYIPWANDFDEAVFATARTKEWFDKGYPIKDDLAVLVCRPLHLCDRSQMKTDFNNVISLLRDDWEQIVNRMQMKETFYDKQALQTEEGDTSLQDEIES